MEVEDRKVFLYDGQLKEEKRSILVESELLVKIGGKEKTYNCTLSDVEDFIVGRLFTQGLIEVKEDIKELEIIGKKAEVEIEKTGKKYKGHSSAKIKADDILSIIEDFNRSSSLFKAARASHSCALYEGTDLVLQRDDIGRHNALDKVIGAIITQGIDVENHFIYITGRLPLMMVEKLKRIGISSAISLAKPTNLAIDYAEKENIMIIGETRRPGSFTLYSSIERLSL